MKASELIKELQNAIQRFGDREVVCHDGNFDAVENGTRQFMEVTFGSDAAGDDVKMPFEIWAHENKQSQ